MGETVLGVAVAALVTEGACVAANGGDCPLGPLQQRLGDPVPLFLGLAAIGILALVPFRSSYGRRFSPGRG